MDSSLFSLVPRRASAFPLKRRKIDMAYKGGIPLTILRRRQVEIRTGLSRSTIYQRVAEKTFPSPVRLGSRAVGWLEGEIDDWLQNQVDRSRNVA